ncbi:MAG: DUF2203 domain-containing protein [Acidobacteria bacterium]|nr:DUF2203 domain-containing protein [Acidobacteriota bacterium]
MQMETEGKIKLFTLTEARLLLPRVRKLMERISAERRLLMNVHSDIERARKNSEGGGGSPYGAYYLNHITSFGRAVREVERLGVQIKDFDKGLIDFPCSYKGRIVLLCWKIGETEIDYWHEIEAGYAGRRLITDDFDEPVGNSMD